MKITFIGLGIMGSHMATHLINNEVQLTVYNRSADKTEAFKHRKVTVAHSVQSAVQHADLVLSMLSTPEVVSAVFFGENHALAHMKKNSIWADCTTVNPSFSLKAHQEAQKHNIRFMDTPVAGSKPQAKDAALVFFAGGDQKTLSEINPYLSMMGKKVVHVGDTGKGAAFKMVVNMMLAQAMLNFSEATLLGASMGISKEFLLSVLPDLAVAAPFTKLKAKAIESQQYDVQFPLAWMHKDLHLACVSAYEQNQPLFLTHLAKELFAAAQKEGLGRLDFSAIYKYLEGKPSFF